jgi:Flp pilus assembly protein CpaB
MKLRYVMVIGLLAFLVGATLSGVLVTILFLRTNLRGPDTAEVLVVHTKVTRWTTIRDPEAMFEVVSRRTSKLPPQYVPAAELQELKGRRLRVTLEAGQVLTSDHLLEREVGGLNSALERGQRAMTVPIEPDRAVGFFVVPGARVDVIHSKDGKSSVLLEDILVLAIDLTNPRAEETHQWHRDTPTQ